MNIAFIGLGNMAGAILRGMRASGSFAGDTLLGYDVAEQNARALQEEIGLRPLQSLAAAAGQCDVLVLAVKPQMMAGVLADIRDTIGKGTLAITIAAGLPLAFYQGVLGNDIALVRVMPNLNARVRLSCSAMCAAGAATPEHMRIARTIFESIGSVEILPESLFAAFSAIAGAAPAFVFQFADALASAGVKAGLSRSLAQRTAAHMLLGSARLMVDTNEHPRVLMDQVCSPGGTTIEGVHALHRLGFDAAVHEAVQAVITKDKKLGEA